MRASSTIGPHSLRSTGYVDMYGFSPASSENDRMLVNAVVRVFIAVLPTRASEDM